MKVTAMVCALLILLVHSQKANADGLLDACKAKIDARFTKWRFASLDPEVAEYSRSRQVDPTITHGDFDGDGRGDIALLIQDGPNPKTEYPERLDSLHIAACLNMKAGIKLFFIDRPYCGDGITLTPKGRAYYDYDTGEEGTYRHDGIGAYCFERAGATYEFENGVFRQIVDSD